MKTQNKIVLINTPLKFNEYKFTSIQFPLNLGYLSSYVKQYGYECAMWDYAAEPYDAAGFAQRVIDAAPPIIGFSCITPNIGNGHEMARIIKEIRPETTIIVGGPHCTALPARTLEEFPNFDAVVTCEGEETFLEVCGAVDIGLSFDGIAGTAHRSLGGDIVVEPTRPVPSDLDALPFPDRELRPPGKYNKTHPTKVVLRSGRQRVIEIITIRGCPFDCFFCAGHGVFQHSTRMRSVENITAEIDECRERYGLDFLLFQDDTFVLHKPRVEALCAALAERKLSWSCNARANIVDRKMLEMMARSGCKKVAFGVESGSDDILVQIDKHITTAQVKEAVRAAREAGIPTVEGTIIIGGHPTETAEQLNETLRFIKQIDLDFFNADVIVPFPGTPAYDEFKKRNLIAGEDWSKYVPYGGLPQWRTENFSAEELVNFQKLFMSRYYIRPKYILRQIARIRSPRRLIYFFRMAFDYFQREFLRPPGSARN